MNKDCTPSPTLYCRAIHSSDSLNLAGVRWRHTTVRRDNRVARRAGDAPRYLRALAPAPTKSLAHLAGDGPHPLSSLAPAPTESLAHRAGDGPHSLSSLAPAPTQSPAHRAGDGSRFLRALAPAPTKSPDTTTNKEGDNRSSDITSERTNLTGVEETSDISTVSLVNTQRSIRSQAMLVPETSVSHHLHVSITGAIVDARHK